MGSRFFPVSTLLAPLLAVAFLSQASGTPQESSSKPSAPANASVAIPGNEACASCHAEIYKNYQNTVMARASGPAAEGLISGEFNDKTSGVRYRVYERDGKVWMSYERAGKDAIRGERELEYFIGSGVKGRTYLFSYPSSDRGFLFEAPINWYSQEKRWNMTPAYTEAREIPMNLPAFTSCLNCHTSGLRAPIAGTDSKFSGAPFLHDGITCERCHGSGVGHEAGKGEIVNPAKLAPEQRDAICMECHFEGTVAIDQPGKHLYEFQPGERVSDYIHYFLFKDDQTKKAGALSQFEALSLSQCKRKSRDKMWCGSCHDSHREPAVAEKPAYYRSKCLTCHVEAFAARHHPDKPDCVGCHMPALPSKDVAHTQSTDHRILRYPSAEPLPQLTTRAEAAGALVPFPASEAALVTTRDQAVGWEALAQRGVSGASRKAEQFLREALKQNPDDGVLLSAMAYVEQQQGHDAEAKELYEHALRIDPLANDAATNLGILEARAGHLQHAVQLWHGAFERAPHRSEIGMNLAMVLCADGQKDVARKYVEQVLEFNPDYGKAKSLLRQLNSESGQCRP
jgi:tetratricopeptide (TPR) repeat protein